MSLISLFQDDAGDVPPIKFETGYQGKEAERLTRFIWNQVIQLLLTGKELEANSLLEEFDEPPLWDDPLDEAMGTPLTQWLQLVGWVLLATTMICLSATGVL